MSRSARRAEFFSVEAEEYLADLELVASAHDSPDAERMVRGARALRGAALVAGLGTFARAAAGLEALARQLRDETLDWDGATRDQCLSTINALHGLLPRAAAWDGLADREALALAERLERFGGSAPARLAVQESQTLTSGVRAFIAKESALIAGSLERAARALSPLPPPEALAAVLERMRSLRGLGASAELSPLPEMLDAMEIATRTLLGNDPPPPDVAEVFDEAARALAAMARTIAESGRIIAPPELDRVAMHLLTAYAEEPDVVAIADLAPDDEDAIVHLGTPPGPPADAGPVPIELVGVGDHLLLIADTLARPALPVVRDLRLFVLHRTLATMPPRSATGQFLAPLTAAINGAIGHGIAARQLDHFLAMLRDCGRFLIDSGSSTNAAELMRERDRLAAALLRSEVGVAMASPRVVRMPVASEVTVGRVDDAVTVVEAIVNIEQLAPVAESLPDLVQVDATPKRNVPVDVAPVDVAPVTPPIEVAVPIEVAPPVEVAVPDAVADMLPFTIDASPIRHSDDDLEIVAIESLAPDPVMTIPAAQPAPPLAQQQALVTPEMDTVSGMLDIVDVATLAPDNDDDLIGTPIVPIEALAPDDARMVPGVVIPRNAPGEPSRLEHAMRRRHEFARVDESTEPSLERLLQQDILPVTSLLYRGPRALARAAEVQAGIVARLLEPAISLDHIRPDLEELFDLVALARDAA